MRGVDLILMPTTLLAMVDASIGGKTGINTPFGKNLVGTIYPPKAVFTDLNFLSTLPKNQWVNGLAEILKMGLIRNHSLWNLAQKSGKDLELIEMAVKATGDIDTDVRAEAARAVKAIVLAPNYINNSNAFINDLIALYRSSNWQVRMYSIFALGETRNYMARSTIISALDDRDADVRNSARNALNKI